MKAALLIMAAASLITAGAVQAQSGPEVVKAKCAACHDMDTKKVGPAFKDIAAKHKGAKGAEAQLVEKLKEGKGHMKIAATEAEIKAAVGYILAGK